MPNLRGASPVGRDEGGSLDLARSNGRQAGSTLRWSAAFSTEKGWRIRSVARANEESSGTTGVSMSTGALGRTVGVRLRSVTGWSGPGRTGGDPKSFGWDTSDMRKQHKSETGASGV